MGHLYSDAVQLGIKAHSPGLLNFAAPVDNAAQITKSFSALSAERNNPPVLLREESYRGNNALPNNGRVGVEGQL